LNCFLSCGSAYLNYRFKTVDVCFTKLHSVIKSNGSQGKMSLHFCTWR